MSARSRWLFLAVCLALLAACPPAAPALQSDAGAPSACPGNPCGNRQDCVDGKCYDVECGAVGCGAGRVCVNGQCIDNACIDVSCPADSSCARDGECYPRDCSSETCDPGSVCYSTACTLARCVGITCGEGMRCGNDRCLPADCASQTCATTEVCVDERCVPVECVDVACDPGSACARQGACEPKDCATPCGPYEVCVDSVCVDQLCVGVVCQAGTLCAAGRCTPTDCGGLACPDGEVCVAGECIAPECATGRCCPAAECGLQNQCAQETCRGKTFTCGWDAVGSTAAWSPSALDCSDSDPCTVGDQCVGASCKGAPKPCDSPPASTCQGAVRTFYSGECTAGQCNYSPQTEDCAFGCLDGLCKDDPCSGVACPAGEQCVGGTCLKNLGISCGAAGECSSGFCADKVCCDSACNDRVCQRCDASSAGAGTCAFVSTLQDPDDECATATPPAPGSCRSSTCSGTGYACGLLSGEQGQPACMRCDGLSSDPVNVADSSQDSEGSNLCTGTRQCIAGACTNLVVAVTTNGDACTYANDGLKCGGDAEGGRGCHYLGVDVTDIVDLGVVRPSVSSVSIWVAAEPLSMDYSLRDPASIDVATSSDGKTYAACGSMVDAGVVCDGTWEKIRRWDYAFTSCNTSVRYLRLLEHNVGASYWISCGEVEVVAP